MLGAVIRRAQSFADRLVELGWRVSISTLFVLAVIFFTRWSLVKLYMYLLIDTKLDSIRR
jgi:hypothetical protein